MAFPHFSFCIAFWLFTGVGLACCIRRYPVEIAYFLPVCLLLIVWPYNEIRYWTHVFPFALLFFLKGMEWGCGIWRSLLGEAGLCGCFGPLVCEHAMQCGDCGQGGSACLYFP